VSLIPRSQLPLCLLPAIVRSINTVLISLLVLSKVQSRRLSSKDLSIYLNSNPNKEAHMKRAINPSEALFNLKSIGSAHSDQGSRVSMKMICKSPLVLICSPQRTIIIGAQSRKSSPVFPQTVCPDCPMGLVNSGGSRNRLRPGLTNIRTKFLAQTLGSNNT
jgi:hypothetical protein